MTIAPVFVGIDVSKNHLDLFDEAEQRRERIDNAPAAIDSLLARLHGRAEQQARTPQTRDSESSRVGRASTPLRIALPSWGATGISSPRWG